MHDPEFNTVSKGPGPGTMIHRVVARLRGHERAVITGAVGFQLLVLVGIVLANTIPWAGSGVRTVLLRVVPVDPRDLMRGDYVILGYEISRVPPGAFLGGSAGRERRGRAVYVVLEPEEDGRHYHGAGVVEEPPASGPFIRGTLDGSGRIVFGIESFFVQEGKGKEYEQAIRDRRLSAEVALTRDGRAALRRLVFD